MADSTPKSGFNWQILVLIIFGISAVGGIMYMLFTDSDYNGFGGRGVDSSYIANVDSGKAQQSKEVPKTLDTSAKADNTRIAENKPVVVTNLKVETPPAAKVEVKPQPVVVKPQPVVVKPQPVVVKPQPVVVKPQ